MFICGFKTFFLTFSRSRFRAAAVPVEGAAYKTFHSSAAASDVSYQVYLPPGYEQQAARYPVLYELPASGQTTRGGAEVVRRVDQAIRTGKIPPMIIILVNGPVPPLHRTATVRERPTRRGE